MLHVCNVSASLFIDIWHSLYLDLDAGNCIFKLKILDTLMFMTI